MIKELAQHVEDQTTLIFTPGSGETQDLYAGPRLPGAPDRSTALLETSPGRPDPDLAGKYEYLVQVHSRAATYMTARSDAWEVFDALHGKGNAGVTLPSVSGGPQYLTGSIVALATPQSIGQDDNGLYQFSTNYRVMVEEEL